jgi:hypothetical protein
VTYEPGSTGAPGAPRFPLVGAALTVLLITVTGLAILAWVARTLAVGSDAPWTTALIGAVVPALLIAFAARLVFVALLPQPPSYAVVAVAAYAVIVLVAGASVWVADRAFQTGEQRAAEACTADEVAALRSIVLGDDLAVDPVGERDGSCTLELTLPGTRDGVQTGVATAMSDAGFTEIGNELGVRTFTRGEATVVVEVGIRPDSDAQVVILVSPPS